MTTMTDSRAAEAQAQPTPIGDLLADYEANGCDFTDLAWVRAAARGYVKTMPDSQARCLLHVLAQTHGGGEVVLTCGHEGWSMEPWDACGNPIIGTKVTLYTASPSASMEVLRAELLHYVAKTGDFYISGGEAAGQKWIAVTRRELEGDHAQQPVSDAEWIKHPQTIEAKAQWDAVAQVLGADKDDPDAVLAAAQRAQQPATISSGFDAGDMAEAAAQGFRDGEASVGSAGVRALLREYRPSMDIEVLHAWAQDVVRALTSQLPAEAQAQGCGEYPMTEAEVRKWIDACNHEPARQVLRDYLRLRAAPPSAPADTATPPSVPVGWKLVPVEPTEAMQDAHRMYGDTSDWWNAMLAAAPALAQQPASDGGFTSADMMDARQEGRKEAQQLAAQYERLAEALRVIEGFTMSQFRDAADMAGACVETAHNALHPTAAQENDDA